MMPVLAQTSKRAITTFLIRAYSAKTDVPTFETLAVSVPKPNVYHVELNRPKKLNTFNIAMWKELYQCFSSLSENAECRVIVLSGQGKHFTAGIDLSSLVEMHQKINEIEDVARKCRFTSTYIKMCQDGISVLEDCRKPVLSVIHNACIGAGVDLITAADVRYCTEDSFFQVTEVDVGLAADVGTLQRLPKVINNMSVARELCFTARKFDAKEASQLGLVSKVFPDKDSALKNALEVAENIAAKSPVAVQVTKESMVYSLNRTNTKGLKHIALINQAMLQSEDLVKSAMAQATKGERPQFENF